MCCGRTSIAANRSTQRIDATKDGQKITTVVSGYGPVVQYDEKGNIVREKVVYSASNGIIPGHARLSATRHRSELPVASGNKTTVDLQGIPDATEEPTNSGGNGDEGVDGGRKNGDRKRNKNDRRAKPVDENSD